MNLSFVKRHFSKQFQYTIYQDKQIIFQHTLRNLIPTELLHNEILFMTFRHNHVSFYISDEKEEYSKVSPDEFHDICSCKSSTIKFSRTTLDKPEYVTGVTFENDIMWVHSRPY